jgi:hypothetical protein
MSVETTTGSPQKERDAQAKTLPLDTDLFTRFFLLVSKLPVRGGKPMALTCEKCHTWSGLVANSAGIVMGQFAPDIRRDGGILSIATVLVHAILIDDRKVSMKCMRCGFVTRWRR